MDSASLCERVFSRDLRSGGPLPGACYYGLVVIRGAARRSQCVGGLIGFGAARFRLARFPTFPSRPTTITPRQFPAYRSVSPLRKRKRRERGCVAAAAADAADAQSPAGEERGGLPRHPERPDIDDGERRVATGYAEKRAPRTSGFDPSNNRLVPNRLFAAQKRQPA